MVKAPSRTVSLPPTAGAAAAWLAGWWRRPRRGIAFGVLAAGIASQLEPDVARSDNAGASAAAAWAAFAAQPGLVAAALVLAAAVGVTSKRAS